MNRITRYYYKFAYHFSKKIRIKIARKLGVRFTEKKGEERCTIMTNPFDIFGSEPYLITIGKHVEITTGVRFITHDGGAWVLREDPEYFDYDFFGPVKIGNNVFFGNNAIVLPNVTIGDNCIIGAGAIVTRDIPPNSVAVGIPARVVETIDEYKKKIGNQGAVKTKKLDSKRKEQYIRNAHPEWF